MTHFLSKCIADEEKRQSETFELIASENFPSSEVLQAAGTVFNNKYAEGYPELKSVEEFKTFFPDYVHTGKTGRYYGGCHNVDMIELYGRYMFQKAFHVTHSDPHPYHVNVQPHAGSQANFAAYASVLKTGDTILSPSLESGGHLTHSSPVNFVSKMYHVVTYGINEKGYYDYEEIRRIALECKPQLILAGASAYPRIIDFAQFRAIADEVGAYFMVDMAHIAGLVAGGVHPSPFDAGADIVTTTTHKTLRSIRGGLIFCKPELANKVDSSVFPKSQGGPLPQMLAAKAQGAYEATTPEYAAYIRHILTNCDAMAQVFLAHGFELVTGGTDNHLLIVDLSRTHPHVSGRQVQDHLDTLHITLNKEMIPGDKRSPMETSGIRIGSAAETTRFKTEKDFREVAAFICKQIDTLEENEKNKLGAEA